VRSVTGAHNHQLVGAPDQGTRSNGPETESLAVGRPLGSIQQVLVNEGRKAEAVYSFFDAVLGTTPLRANSINLELLDLPSLDLHGLGNRFTEEEVLHVIRSLRPDKAPPAQMDSWPDFFRSHGKSFDRI
jgi:hypothetical protein